jgi:hypothetical protein
MNLRSLEYRGPLNGVARSNDGGQRQFGWHPQNVTQWLWITSQQGGKPGPEPDIPTGKNEILDKGKY